MTVDIVIPALGESITEATILRWAKKAGEAVEQDEIVVEIETDKATMELTAPEAGVLSEILKDEGEKVQIGDVIARVKDRIGSSALVIADLTAANPNVYLEVGYAWGRGVRTVLIIAQGDELKFDVRSQRVLVFGSIRHLEELLTTELKALT